MHSILGRDVIVAAGASLGAISAAGIPGTVTWTDASNNTITATVSQAAQLTSEYVLLTYASDAASGTAVLDMTTGALASVSVVPDNWAMIFARGSQAWYESGGGIWSCALATGACMEVSASGILYGGFTLINSSYPWDSGTTWIYADSSGNVYAIDLTSGGYISASAMAGGKQTNFGDYNIAYRWGTWLPIGLGDSHYWVVFDPSSNALYLLQNDSIGGPGTGQPAQTLLDLYAVTLDPAAPGVITIGSTPIASSVVTAFVYGSTNIGGKTALDSTIFSNGPQTWTVGAGGTLTSYDTSSVPVVNNGIIGQVLNWQWSGGCTYAGPSSAQTINLVQLSGATGTPAQLVNDAQTIESWSVVGGVLFFTDATGTYQAAVNTASATIATPTLYAGGTVQGITQ
jgi:hypothetical protein